jgi:hypothetical protein
MQGGESATPSRVDTAVEVGAARASIAAIMPTPGDARKYEGIDSTAMRGLLTPIGGEYNASQSGNPCRCSESPGEVVGSPDIGKPGVSKQ